MELTRDVVRQFVPRSVQDEVLAKLTVDPEKASGATDTQPPRRRLEMRAVDLSAESGTAEDLFDESWPAWRSWYLREGDRARPSLAECRRQLTRHMPELMPVWERLSQRVRPGDDLAARFLSQYRPPALTSACSNLALPEPALLRNYDYDPDLFDSLVTRTDYLRPVVGTSDQFWGLLDGVNDAGLAASFTFGGREAEGDGFGVPLVIRYLLETCENVHEAASVLRRIPVHVPYNVTVVDAAGNHATVFVGPDRDAGVTASRVTTNHQESVDWPEHAARIGSVTRLSRLSDLVADTPDHEAAATCMLSSPMRAERYDIGFGTLYTAVMLPVEHVVEYRWPGSTWRLSCDAFEEGTHVVEVPEERSGGRWAWAGSSGARAWAPAAS
ncbi:MAG: C45 family autoproteolytic acyltransferase/hydrolase [Actinomycetes bacterium]